MFDVPVWEPERIRGFAAGLVDLDAGLTSAAIQRYLATSDRRPQLSNIRSAVVAEMDRAGMIPHELTIDEAMALLTRAAARGNDFRFPKEKYPLVWAAIEAAGGWWDATMSTNRETHRAQFRDAYRQQLERRVVDRVIAPGLRLPDDAERMQMLATPIAAKELTHVEPEQPTREEAAAAVKEIIALAQERSTRAIVHASSDPTDEEIARREERKRILKQQLADMGATA